MWHPRTETENSPAKTARTTTSISLARSPGPSPEFGFAGHVHFIDFEDFGRKNPVWVAQVREPIGKFTSK